MLCVSDGVVGLGTILSICHHFVDGSEMKRVFTIFNSVVLTIGLHLSLYHTFLISLQRFLVIYKERWSYFIFRKNRKYFACCFGWLVVSLGNCVLISPPSDFAPLDDVNVLAFVYHLHYNAYITYIRIFSMCLLSSTILLYLAATVIVMKSYKQITHIGHSTNVRVITVKSIQTGEPRASEIACTSFSAQRPVRINPGPSHVEQASQVAVHRRKRVVSILQLVGVLVSALVILTGPFVIAVAWPDIFSIQIRRIFLCPPFEEGRAYCFAAVCRSVGRSVGPSAVSVHFLRTGWTY
jgi:hypothetical protein